MGKFTEPAYFLLEHYLESLNYNIEEDLKSKIVDLWPVIFTDWDNNTEYFDYNDVIWNFEYETVEGPYSKKQVNWSYNGSYLTGKNKGIVAVGDRIIQLFVKDEDRFREIFVTPLWNNQINGNFFNLEKHITLQYEHGSTLTETLSGSSYYFEVYTPNISLDPEDLNDKEVYFRKDSQFHQWLIKNANDYFKTLWNEDFVIRNYVNTDKKFLYFGKIFNKRKNSSKIESSNSNKNQYHIEFYGMKDFVMNAIPYHQRTPKLTEFMEVEFDRNFQEIYNLLKNIWSMIDPYEVDEKYLGYLAAFYNINIDNYNILNKREYIKELTYYLKKKGSYGSFYAAWKIVTQGTWNNLFIYDKWIKKSNIPLNGNVNPDDFILKLYTDQYNNLSLNADDYILTPYYKVQFDLSTEPITYREILPKDIIEGLLFCYKDLRPANKVAEYEILLKPEIYLNKRTIALYEGNLDRYSTNVLTTIKKFSICVNNAHIALFGGSDYTTFDIKHDLNTNNIFIKCYDMDYNEIIPLDIEFLDGDNIRVTFEYNFDGFVLLRKPDYTNIRYTNIDRWVIKHPFSQKDVYVEFNKDKEKIYSDETILINEDFISTNLKSGVANISKPDLVYIQSIDNNIWNINHNLGYKGVLISCFDENNNEMIPKDIEFIDINNSIVTFEDNVKGHAMIVSVGNPLFADMVLERTIVDGEELFLLPFFETNSTINNFETYNYRSRINSYYETDDALYLILDIPKDIELTIKEIRIYDLSDNILIYTECGDIFKPMNVKMKIEYKINKYTTKGSL